MKGKHYVSRINEQLGIVICLESTYIHNISSVFRGLTVYKKRYSYLRLEATFQNGTLKDKCDVGSISPATLVLNLHLSVWDIPLKACLSERRPVPIGET